MEATIEQQRLLIEALLASASNGEKRLIETHISWVLLTGDVAYKIKKAVNFGFLDYSTLDQRRHCCEEELRLNRRTAPELYLAVVSIGGSHTHPVVEQGAPIEWAVKMRRFPQEDLLDHQLAMGTLTPNLIDAAARSLADFHAAIPAASTSAPYGDPEAIYRPVTDNFPALTQALGGEGSRLELNRHAAWAAQHFEALRPTFIERKRRDRVRECHGDLHLGNLLRIGDRVVPFDAVEFNPYLRWIDVANELAFAAMDLEARRCPELARHLINAYLERTGDYGAVALLDFYKHYRAMVRAKVTALRYTQLAPGETTLRLRLLEEVGAYLTLAAGYLAPTHPALVLTCGVTGSGKTRLAGALVDHLPRTVRLRSDVERKRLFGLDAEASSGSAVGSGLYTAEATRRTYDRLAQLAGNILKAGYVAVVDATFLRHADREALRAVAQTLGVQWLLVMAQAPEEVLRTRVAARLALGRDASEADLAVLDHQLASFEPLTPTEQEAALLVDTHLPYSGQSLARAVMDRLNPP